MTSPTDCQLAKYRKAWSPLAGGLLSGKYSRENQKPEDSRRSASDFPIVDKERAWRILDVLRTIAKVRETSVASVALAWILAKPFVTSVIIGAKRVDQLQQNLSAAEIQLTHEEIHRLCPRKVQVSRRKEGEEMVSAVGIEPTTY